MRKIIFFLVLFLLSFSQAQVNHKKKVSHKKEWINPVKLTKEERSRPYMTEVLKTRDSLSPEEAERRRKNIAAGNPFKKYGYYPKVATLSKGKYLEFHDQDSVVTIGSVRFNVKKGEVVDFLEVDLDDPDAQPIGDTHGRWISPDPLSEEFSSWTPYNYVFNNPISNIDPDGREGLGWGLGKDNVWQWQSDLSADNYQSRGFTEYKADGSVISNATIQGQGGDAGAVYLGLNGQAQSLPAGGATGALQLSNFTRDAISSTLSAVGSAINGIYDVWMIATFSPDPNMNVNTPSATTPVGKAFEMAGSVAPLLGAEASGTKNALTEPVTNTLYKRPNNATTAAQRAAVQGEPCVTCGVTDTKMVANHKYELVKEHYQTGTIDTKRMKSLNAVNSQCQTCSAQQGAAMSQYSKEMKKIIQQRTNGK